MVTVGNVKLGKRIEPIYVQELSRREVFEILQAQGIHLDENVDYHIDARIVNVFKTDKQRLTEYIDLCKYAMNRKMDRTMKRPNVKDFSIFSDELQISYEMKHLKESEKISDFDKVSIYRQARETQGLFRMFGANNVKLEINLLDRAYFEIQSFIQAIRTKGNVKALTEGKTKDVKAGEFRKQFFDEKVKKATERISKTWEEKPKERDEKGEITKS